MGATISPSDAAALIAAIGGVIAAGVGVREYRLKTAAQRVEIDVKLSQLLAELIPVANGWGPREVSDAAAEAIVHSQMKKGASPKEIGGALASAVITIPVGEATQASAITSIGYLGAEHVTLRESSYHALQALDFADSRPKLAAARKSALAMVAARRS